MPNHYAVFAGVCLALLTTGCSSPETPSGEAVARGISTDEAERLAVVRFNNFRTGSRGVSAEFSTQGVEVALNGTLDFDDGLGFVAVTPRQDSAAGDLAIWSHSTLRVLPGTSARVALPVPGGARLQGWGRGALQPDDSTLHTVLATLLAIGADRPDNPLLIQQGGAKFLRSDEISGTEVDVFSGPQPQATSGDESVESNLRYWIDDAGLLLRLELRVPSGDSISLDFTESPKLDLKALKGALTQ